MKNERPVSFSLTHEKGGPLLCVKYDHLGPCVFQAISHETIRCVNCHTHHPIKDKQSEGYKVEKIEPVIDPSLNEITAYSIDSDPCFTVSMDIESPKVKLILSEYEQHFGGTDDPEDIASIVAEMLFRHGHNHMIEGLGYVGIDKGTYWEFPYFSRSDLWAPMAASDYEPEIDF